MPSSELNKVQVGAILPGEVADYLLGYDISIHRGNGSWTAYTATMKERHENLCVAISNLVYRIIRQIKDQPF